MKMLLLVATLALAGCQTAAPMTQVVERRVEVPPSLLTCLPEPKAREVWKSQREVGLYLVRLAEAGEDCRTKLDVVRGIVSRP